MGHGFVTDDAVDGGNAGDVFLCANVVLKQSAQKQNSNSITGLECEESWMQVLLWQATNCKSIVKS